MRYAWNALRRRPGRAIASALGIGLATALVVTLLSVSDGVQASATRIAVSSGVDLLATSANSSLGRGAFPSIDGAHALPAAMAAADPNVETASPWLLDSLTFANASLRANASNGSVPAGWGPTSSSSVGWIPSESAGLELPAILQGPGYPVAGDPHYDGGRYEGNATHAIVLDEQLAAILHVDPGDALWVSPLSPSGPSALPGWFATAERFTVVGVSEPFWLIPSALLAFLYLSELQSLTSSTPVPSDAASVVLIHLTDPTNPGADQARLAQAFPSLSVYTLGDILSAVQQAISLYRTFGTMISTVGLVVATLFATTVLLMSVDDRSRELALFRAIGFSRSTVVRYVVEEGLLLSGFGLLAGLGLGYLGGFTLNRLLVSLVSGLPAGFSFVLFDAPVVLTALGEVAAIALVASVLPAVRALRLPVAEELRAP